MVSEPEFGQACAEIHSTLAPVFEKHPDLKQMWDIVKIPERIIQFRVVRRLCQSNFSSSS
jgi:glutamate dehydrogenase (NADP+)